MPLTQQQITLFSQRAKAAGLNDSQIQVAIAKKEAEMQSSGAVPTTQPEVITPAANLPDPTAQANQGNIVTNTVKSIVDPALKFGALVGESVAQASRAIVDPIKGTEEINTKITELTKKSQEAIKKAKESGDPNARNMFLQESRDAMAEVEQLGNQARQIGDTKETFIMKDGEAIADRGKILETGVKRTAGAAAYAVPGGTGVKAAIAAGATSGALSGIASSEGQNVQDTAGNALTGAVTGGAVGGAFALTGKAVSKVLKFSTKPTDKEASLLTRIGQSLREDATQIKVNSSVYGAKKEKLIQETLDTLGITGGPAEKYEQLEPAMKAISDKIDEILTQNPNDEVLAVDLVKAFKGKLQSEVRTKTLTSKVADQEIKGYLTDLVRASSSQADEVTSKGTGLVDNNSIDAQNTIDFINGGKKSTVKLDMLVKLKKLANQDYGTIADKLEKGTPLTDREKVAFYARQTLDEAITQLQPKIKDLTVMQSHLYDAARPLAAARNTTPTFRIAGFTVPKEKVIEDWIGRGLISLDDKSKSLLQTWVDPVTRTLKSGYESMNQEDLRLVTDALTKISVISSANGMTDQSGNEQTNIEQTDQGGNNQNGKNYDLQNETQVTSPMGVNSPDIIPQGSNHPIPKFRQYANKDQMIASAFADGLGTKDVQELVKLWDAFAPQQSGSTMSPEVKALIEQRSVLSKAGLTTKSIDAKLAQYGFEPAPDDKALSATTENRVQLATSGLRALTDIEKMIKDDPSKVFKNVLPGKLGARDYDSAAFKAVEGLLRARSGAAIPETEVRRYMNANLPRIGDSQEEISYKLESLRKDLEDVALSSGSFSAQDALGM